MNKKILDILFWLALIIGIILLVWKIFGNSPSDVAILVPFIVMSLVKIWSNSETIKDIRHEIKILSINTKSAFEKIKTDISKLEKSGRR